MSEFKRFFIIFVVFSVFAGKNALSHERYSNNYVFNDLPTIEVNLDILKTLEESKQEVPFISYDDPKIKKNIKKKNIVKRVTKKVPSKKKINKVKVKELPKKVELIKEAPKVKKNIKQELKDDILIPPGVVKKEDGSLEDVDQTMAPKVFSDESSIESPSLEKTPNHHEPKTSHDENVETKEDPFELKDLKLPESLDGDDEDKLIKENLNLPKPIIKKEESKKLPIIEKNDGKENEKLPLLPMLNDFDESNLDSHSEKDKLFSEKESEQVKSKIDLVNLGSKLAFKFNDKESVLNLNHKNSLDRLVGSLNAHNNSKVNIVGYSDVKNDISSRRFALQRVIAIRKYMIDKGIDASRLQIKAISNLPDVSSSSSNVEVTFTDQLSDFKY